MEWAQRQIYCVDGAKKCITRQGASLIKLLDLLKPEMRSIFITIIVIGMVSCASNKYVSIEMPHSEAKSILTKSGYTEITDQHSLGFVSGHSLWLSPENTALLIVLYHPEPDAKIYQMTLGEKGKGYENWLSQNLQDIKELR